MGFGLCRFGCGKKSSIDYHIFLSDLNTKLEVCGMWKHYAQDHNCLPTKEVRDAVMKANPEKATAREILYMGEQKTYKVLFVELDNIKIGTQPDTKFINKLEKLIE